MLLLTGVVGASRYASWDGESMDEIKLIHGESLYIVKVSIPCLSFLMALAVRRDCLRREIGGGDAPSSAQVILRRTPSEILGAIALLRRTHSARRVFFPVCLNLVPSYSTRW